MAVSRKCEECYKVTRCQMYTDRAGRPVYLCRADAKALGYLEKGEEPR
jgi:hypothetical protein